MPARLSLIGLKFGKLKVISDAPVKLYKTYSNCVCDCGENVIVSNSLLNSGHTKSCGCIKKEFGRTTFVHGQAARGSVTSEYRTWAAMIRRCSNSNDKSYLNYGGRGITVSDEWKNSFVAFITDMGKRPKGLTLERIDNSLGYCKSNCKWDTRKNQNRNKRNVKTMTVSGITGCMPYLCEKFGINYAVVRTRIDLGWPLERALLEPIHQKQSTNTSPERS